MTLKECRELGHLCGLETDKECILNVEIHALSLFKYEDIDDELEELYTEYNEEKR